MACGESLIGRTILVVEDDFHLATCTRDALIGAGAEVIGPVGQEDQALALIGGRALSCAVIDINLGQGARFTIADALKAQGIPFMFMTGYDDVMIPERFDDVGRMRKPFGCRLAVQAAAQMCRQHPGGQPSTTATPEYMPISSIRKTASGECATRAFTNIGGIPADGTPETRSRHAGA